jgi:hypothetical protein
LPNSNIIAIGNRDAIELRAAVEWLEAQDAVFFEAAHAALWQLTAPPRWIYLLSERRGVFAQADIEALHRIAPLARLVAICGSWCEGEPRTGRPLAGVHRVYAHQFRNRASAASSDNDFAGWCMPRTATPIDISLQRSHFPSLRGTIGVLADRRADYEALADALHAMGCKAVSSKAPDVAAWVYNGSSFHDRAERELRMALAMQKPVVALFDAPRADEIERALRLGVAEVISKPFLLGDLYGALVKVTEQLESSWVA